VREYLKSITIDLSVRLPDINSYRDLPAWFSDYGRFGILKNGSYWFAGIQSSHPAVLAGFYWALNETGDVLYLSPRGAMNDSLYLTEDLIGFVMGKLQLRGRG
jgi:hypothetical protein